MARLSFRIVVSVGALGTALAWVPFRVAGQSGARSAAPVAMPSTKNGEWPMYTADLRGSKYSPLDQIDATNFNKLEVAWRFKTDNLGPRPENKLEGTPIMVGGMVYTTGGTRRAVVALDARTGELKWVYSMDEGTARGVRAAPALRTRALLLDRRQRRRPHRLRHDRLSARGAERQDRPAGAGVRQERHRRPEGRRDHRQGHSRSIWNAAKSASTPRRRSSTTRSSSARRWPKASAIATAPTRRASSARSMRRPANRSGGSTRFPIPASPATTRGRTDRGNGPATTACGRRSPSIPKPASCTSRSRSPTIDTYGGNRPGNNLFAETLVAVDLKTGVRKWHFQLVHHPIWDHDISSAPLLVDATIDGRPRKLVAQPTKQSFLYVFDRITGQPIWPMPETAVPQTRRARRKNVADAADSDQAAAVRAHASSPSTT